MFTCLSSQFVNRNTIIPFKISVKSMLKMKRSILCLVCKIHTAINFFFIKSFRLKFFFLSKSLQIIYYDVSRNKGLNI